MKTTFLQRRYSTRAIKWAIVAFAVALGVPALVLVVYSYQQLKWEAFHQQRTLAAELVTRIDNQLQQWIAEEEQRSVADYRFLVVSGDVAANFFQPSALSSFPPSGSLPGTLGYFQVDADGTFSSPLLPSSQQEALNYGITAQQYAERRALNQQLLTILHDNQLVPASARLLERADRDRQNEADKRVAQKLAEEVVITGNLARSDKGVTTDDASAQPAPLPAPVRPQPASQNTAQQGFDELLTLKEDKQLKDSPELVEASSKKKASAPLVEELGKRQQSLEKSRAVDSQPSEPMRYRNTRTEQTAVLSPVEAQADAAEPALSSVVMQQSPAREVQAEPVPGKPTDMRVSLFESAIEPMELSLLDSGQLVFFRKVWQDGQRFIQGGLIDTRVFMQQALADSYRNTLLASGADMAVYYRDQVLSALRGADVRSYDLASSLSRTQNLTGERLLQSHLSAPFDEIELVFSVNQLPVGPGGRVIAWAAVMMAVILLGGCYLMYRLSARQMGLARQQQDFVSAVSHELKTPLTSIRMYGEMLREGWADDAKRKQYYDYIYDESERLSRLITNVLQLARMNRNELQLNIKPVSAGELIDNIKSKLSSQVERAGFEFTLDCPESVLENVLMVDKDSLLQVIINLVDNGIKFSQKAETKAIIIAVQQLADDEVQFSVRDFGPGIGNEHLKKIFGLFYRGENELTRETVGTGIGLALVNQLVRAMGGKVDVVNQNPGAEFRITLKIATAK